MDYYDVLIVGVGHAGAQAAISLRQLGFDGSIGMVSDEEELPYERPPLTKEYFAGDKSLDRIRIRPATFWPEHRISLLLGRRVLAVDPARKIVTAGDDDLGYGKLIWAAGGRARMLTCNGANAENVYSVRRRVDVDAIKARLDSITRVTIIGGGYIGLEAAAVLTHFGKKVVVLEALGRVLARVAGEELSRFYEAQHRAHGVELRTNSRMDCIETSNGLATAVLMQDGERIETDMVIVGIGIIPETGPLIAAGAAGASGVDVDEYCRTSLPDIYAAGDCASHTNRFARGARIRLESVQNAHDQARTAAAHLLGKDVPYEAVPWFWSNQYDLKLQSVGLAVGHDQTLLRGDPTTRSFSVLYLKERKLIALDSVNAVKDYVQGRAHVISGATLDPTQLKDSSMALKDISPSR